MSPYKIVSNFLPLLLLVGLQSNQIKCHDIQFNRNTTGVAFSAYIRSSSGQNDWTTYSLADIKTMLKVISGKFTKVATFGVGAVDETYKWNDTYYKSAGQIHSAVAAAILNKEALISGGGRRGNDIESPLQLTIGIWQHDNDKMLESEIQLALESANKANSIYRNTVSGLVFSQSDINTNIDRARQTLEHLKGLQDEATKLKLNLGTRQNCEGIKVNRDSEITELTNIRKEIVELSDFIICEVDPLTAVGPSSAFAGVKNKLTKYKNELKGLNGKIEVFGQTGYPARFNLEHEVDDLMKYWKLCDGWAKENNFTLWMMEAIDNPWKNWDDKAGNMGWWKLKDDREIGKVNGYIEKVDKLMENGGGGGDGGDVAYDSTTVNYYGSSTGQPTSGGNRQSSSSSSSRSNNKKNGAGQVEGSVKYFVVQLITVIMCSCLM